MTVLSPPTLPAAANTASLTHASALNHRGDRGASAEAKAAREFEGLLLQQLLQVLRRTVPESEGGGAGSPSATYMQMFDETIATTMAEGGGIGLAQVMGGAFHGGGDSEGDGISPTLNGSNVLSMPVPNLGKGDRRELQSLRGWADRGVAIGHALPAHGERLGGGTGALQRSAQQLLAYGGERWAKEQALTPQELASGLSIEAPGGAARFNVRDANGYQGYNKCNLFAFELARRAGYAVPVVPRLHGYGFPNANSVTEDAADDRQLRGDWGRVVSGASAPDLQRAIVGQGRAFMLSGSASEGRSGHMAIIERVHHVEYGQDGELLSIDFDGWEARPDGADHLVQRRWNRYGQGSDPGARNGLQDIEIIELMRPASGTMTEQVLAQPHAASVADQGPQDPPGVVRNPEWRQR